MHARFDLLGPARILRQRVDHRHQILQAMAQLLDHEVAMFAGKLLVVDVVQRADPFADLAGGIADGRGAHAVPAPFALRVPEPDFGALRLVRARDRPIGAIFGMDGLEPAFDRMRRPAHCCSRQHGDRLSGRVRHEHAIVQTAGRGLNALRETIARNNEETPDQQAADDLHAAQRRHNAQDRHDLRQRLSGCHVCLKREDNRGCCPQVRRQAKAHPAPSARTRMVGNVTCEGFLACVRMRPPSGVFDPYARANIGIKRALAQHR